MSRPLAVFFDRDDTLIDDVPYNPDPALVVARPGARLALDVLRALGVPTAVVTNQSGVGRGRITLDQVHAVNRRVEELVGPVGPWLICPHAPDDGCTCRKPAPSLVLQAAEMVGVPVGCCVMLGDKRSDLEAASAAGGHAILVRRHPAQRESWGFPAADSLLEAVEMLLAEDFLDRRRSPL